MAKIKNAGKATAQETFLLTEKSSFYLQESLKTLRTNVTFSLPKSDCKVIGIVSANRGEGKSTIALNLAVSFAQINSRVVIIDCDMRLPTIARKLSIKSTPGLSNYLSGDCDDIPVLHLDEHGIDVLPSGNLPPDPTKLIESERMKEMLDKLRAEYDYVIFDFPPVTIVSDAVIMSGMIDGYLLVVRHFHSEYKKIEESLKQLSFASATVLGIVYNGSGSNKKYYKKGKYSSYKYYYYKKNPKRTQVY